MRKLKLDVESLAVQTFETAKRDERKGTVHARDSWETTGGPYFCPAYCENTEQRQTCGVGDTCGMGGLC
jgi:hypothetical protein